jgi:hypothetical protein
LTLVSAATAIGWAGMPDGGMDFTNQAANRELG